jgi:hypothetical protein
MKIKRLLTIISALATLSGAAVSVSAQNLIVNGDFTANAAAFTVSPGYTGGANPAAIANWGNLIPGNVGVNGAATPLGNIFGPVNSGGHTYAFLQGGVSALVQNLPGTYTPGTMYELSFDAAARSGNPSVSFRVQIGDVTQTHVTTQVGAVELTGNPAAFTHYSYTFTSPATFDGAPSIQLYNLTGGDNTINFANVSLVASPEAVRTNVLTDTFNTPDTFDLDADLATRESGLRAPVPTYFSTQGSLNDIIEIKANALKLSRLDTSGVFAMSVSPDANFFTNEVSSSFRVVCDINVQSADPAADSWAGIAVRGIAPLLGPAQGNCFSMLLRPGGGYAVFDGGTSLGAGSLNGQTNYHVVIDVQNNVARITVNDMAVPFAGGQYAHTIVNANAGNHISLANHGAVAAVPASATFDNLAVSVPPPPFVPATPVLADNFDTADSASLNDNLLTRQSGIAATQTWSTVQLNGAAFAINNNSLLITNTGDTSVTNTYGVVATTNLKPYQRTDDFRVRVKISPVVASGDSWGALVVGQSDPSKWILNGDGLGIFVRPGGSWGVAVGGGVPFTGNVPAAATYLVELEFIDGIATGKINGALIASGAISAPPTNIVSLTSNAGESGGGATGVAATFDDFEFTTPGLTLLNMQYIAGTPSFQFYSVAGRVYALDYKANLTDPWTYLSDVTGTGGLQTVSAPLALPMAFFRLTTTSP